MTATATKPWNPAARLPIPPNARCDRCRIAHAHTRVTFANNRVLYLCGHHYRIHGFALATYSNITIHTEPLTCTCVACAGPELVKETKK